ncbi:hypothetical protein Gpo141_00008662 [Globisporangium polare]
MKSSVLSSAVLVAALFVTLTNAQSTPTPTPSSGPSPGTLGASDVAGIAIVPIPTSSGSSSSGTSSTPASVKPGAIGSTASPATSGSLNQDALVDGSTDASLSDLGDQSDDGSAAKSKSSTASSSSGTKAEVKTPAPTPKATSGAQKTLVAGSAIATLAVAAVSYLL